MRKLSVKKQFDTLEKFGLATKYFPCYVNLDESPHKVDVVLLTFIIKGQGVHLMDGERFPESGTSLSITHYESNHCIITEPSGMEIVNIMLDLKKYALPELPEPLASVLPDVLPLHPRFDNHLTQLRRLHFDAPERVIGLIMRLHHELIDRDAGYEAAAIDLFRLFLIECVRQVIRTGTAGPRREIASVHRLEKVRRYIDANYRKPLVLDELAAVSGLSSNYLCMVFKEYSGKTIFNYIIERRIQNAIIQLLSTRKKVIAIAFDCGFNDLSYFNRSFKKITGQSPVSYRGQMQK
jgi:AraC-like DNA-binding protein